MGIDWKQFGFNVLEMLAADMLMGRLAEQFESWPEDRFNGLLIRFGKAFGPPWLDSHFSQLGSQAQEALLARVPVLRGTHTDWPAPLHWVPRTALVWTGRAPEYSDVLMGQTHGQPADLLKPIPKPGEFVVLPGYMAETYDFNLHYRLGFRWDDVDSYYELSLALKTV